MAMMAREVRRFGGTALLGAVLVGCSPNTAIRGNIPTESQIQLVRPGVHGEEDVRSILGTPSVTSTFDEKTWYYIGRRTEQYAFFRRETVEQQVLIIRFDANGTVDTVATLDEKDGREFDLVERETPSAGRKLNALQQILGNIGRFSNEPSSEP